MTSFFFCEGEGRKGARRQQRYYAHVSVASSTANTLSKTLSCPTPIGAAPALPISALRSPKLNERDRHLAVTPPPLSSSRWIEPTHSLLHGSNEIASG